MGRVFGEVVVVLRDDEALTREGVDLDRRGPTRFAELEGRRVRSYEHRHRGRRYRSGPARHAIKGTLPGHAPRLPRAGNTWVICLIDRGGRPPPQVWAIDERSGTSWFARVDAALFPGQQRYHPRCSWPCPPARSVSPSSRRSSSPASAAGEPPRHEDRNRRRRTAARVLAAARADGARGRRCWPRAGRGAPRRRSGARRRCPPRCRLSRRALVRYRTALCPRVRAHHPARAGRRARRACRRGRRALVVSYPEAANIFWLEFARSSRLPDAGTFRVFLVAFTDLPMGRPTRPSPGAKTPACSSATAIRSPTSRATRGKLPAIAWVSSSTNTRPRRKKRRGTSC